MSEALSWWLETASEYRNITHPTLLEALALHTQGAVLPLTSSRRKPRQPAGGLTSFTKEVQFKTLVAGQ